MKNAKQKNYWPLGITAAFISFFAFMMAMLTLAIKNSPDLISKNYYAEGANLREVLETQRSANSIGWKFEFAQFPASRNDSSLLQISVVSENGIPCDSLIGQISLYRPSNSNSDLSASEIRPLGQGKYYIKLPRQLERGAWQAIVNLKQQSVAYRNRINFFVDQ